MQQRREKAARLREQGQNPFANDVRLDKRSTVQQLRIKFEAALLDAKELRYDPAKVEELGNQESFLVFGRIVLRRGFGKASFIRLRDGSGELQLFAKRVRQTIVDGLRSPARWQATSPPIGVKRVKTPMLTEV